MKYSGALICLLLISNVIESNTLAIGDKPVGFASVSKPSNTIEVSTKADLIKYAKTGGYIIYVKQTIDVSEGYRPSSAGGTTSKLDSLVKTCTSSKYSSYTAFRDAYAKGCSTSTNDKSYQSIYDCFNLFFEKEKLSGRRHL